MPSKCVSTGPRKYICAGGGARAVEAHPHRDAVVARDLGRPSPCFIVFDRPVVETPSCGTPQSGPMRGKSTNSSDHHRRAEQRGARRPARPPGARLGWPTGMCASTSAVSSPHTETSIATATGSDCE